MIKNIISQIYFQKISEIQKRIPISLNIPNTNNNSSFLKLLNNEIYNKNSNISSSAFDQYINTAASKYKIPPELIKSIISVESNFNPKALSKTGAQGLMQLMPVTAKDMEVIDPWDPQQNIEGGTRYLRNLLDKYGGNLILALAAYNAGPTNVNRYGGIPPFPETKNYIYKVINQLKTYTNSSATL